MDKNKFSYAVNRNFYRRLNMPIRNQRGRFLKLFLGAALICFATAAAGTSYVVLEQSAAAHRLARYDIAWDAGQGAIELLRLDTLVSRLQMGLPGGSYQLLTIRYAILQNRIDILNRPEFGDFLSSHSELTNILSNFSQAVTEIGPLVVKPAQPGALKQILQIMRPQEGALVRLASMAARISSSVRASSSISRRLR